ncbi:uncharacterized protein LOC115431732 [Sphaeramia orbicularis]|uniref:uncharacterized protein LOC115431732 n=1 Tax=Sphaeramia orbicularis TaxID=375764 RepID=UPI00117D85CC|nr:uncharacterized protein LOC115431732 [Sphaeramia orbicularis]
MINILVADMTEKHGTAPPRNVREMYARGIVELSPYLMDPYSKNGYEHVYDGESGSGYLAWRLKTIQRRSALSESRSSSPQLTGGPAARGEAPISPEMTLSEEQCQQAMALMRYCTDEATIKQKMKMTFQHCRSMVLHAEKSSDVLTEFPCFKVVKGLIEQDFILQFGEDVAARFMERKHLNSKHAENIESEAETDGIVDSYDTADDTRSQHFEGVASSSKALPAPNINTRDMCAPAIAQLQVAGNVRSSPRYGVLSLSVASAVAWGDGWSGGRGP